MSKSRKVPKDEVQKVQDKKKSLSSSSRKVDKVNVTSSSDKYKVRFTDGSEYSLLDYDASKNRPKTVRRSTRNFSASALGTTYYTSSAEGEASTSGITTEVVSGKGYNLTNSELKKLTIACIQENGRSEMAIKGEASLMCNLYQKRGSRYTNVLTYVMNGGWFGRATRNAVNSNKYSPSDREVSWVKDVVVNGNRTIPLKVNEHDCYSDILWIKNNGKTHISRSYINNPNNYTKDKTIVRNRYGSTWTFYCFMRADNSGDPYGYTG